MTLPCVHTIQIIHALGEADRRASLIEIAAEEYRCELEDKMSVKDSFIEVITDDQLGVDFEHEIAELLFEATKCPATDAEQLVQFTKLNDMASKLKDQIIEFQVGRL
jgi:hypothetical protein